MQIFINTFAGYSAIINVLSDYTIEQIKSIIKEKRVFHNPFNLVYKNICLEDSLTLADYGIEDRDTIIIL
jgi:hypothetical protein